MDTVLVKNADRMMMVATIVADGVRLSFADGCKGMIPYSDIDEINDDTDLSGLELPNPYAMILNTVDGERIEIPWDFARHYCDESYRPTVEAIAMRGRRTLGERLRALRDSAGLTQEELALSGAGVARYGAYWGESTDLTGETVGRGRCERYVIKRMHYLELLTPFGQNL